MYKLPHTVLLSDIAYFICFFFCSSCHLTSVLVNFLVGLLAIDAISYNSYIFLTWECLAEQLTLNCFPIIDLAIYSHFCLLSIII